MFLTAGADVVAALAQWIKAPRSGKAGDVLNAFIRENNHAIRPRRPKRVPVCTRGVHFDLTELYREVNEQEFGGAVDVPITWGRMSASGRRRSIRFGSYSEKERLIRIHPLIDQAFVPRYFVRYIVYHEMLHAFLGVGRSESGRRQIHPREYKKREAAYPDYERAVAWQRDPENLNRFLGRSKARHP
jgi:hypothetical protein